MAATQEAGYGNYLSQTESVKNEYNHIAAIPDVISESNIPKTPQAIAERLRER